MNSNLRLALLISKVSKQQYCINTFACAIGRAAGNNIVIANDGLMSRQHAVFLYRNGQLYIQDVGSRNGTLVNGKIIKQSQMVALQSGDEICLGMSLFTFTDLTKEMAIKRAVDTLPLDTMQEPELVA